MTSYISYSKTYFKIGMNIRNNYMTKNETLKSSTLGWVVLPKQKIKQQILKIITIVLNDDF
jgi:hypothetical protein